MGLSADKVDSDLKQTIHKKLGIKRDNNEGEDGGVVTNSIGQIASNVVGRAPASQLEAQIQAELKK